MTCINTQFSGGIFEFVHDESGGVCGEVCWLKNKFINKLSTIIQIRGEDGWMFQNRVVGQFEQIKKGLNCGKPCKNGEN